MKSFLRQLSPSMGKTSAADLAAAMVGTALALLMTDGLLFGLRAAWPLQHASAWDEILLVSPFAATAFLIITTPNSPLSQPWSVVVGNVSAVLIGALCVRVIPSPVFMASSAVALSVFAMAHLRALHPPAVAMALNTVLLSMNGASVSASFLLATVCVGTSALVLFGVLFHAVIGRRYPFRQMSNSSTRPVRGLEALLERMRLSANIGPADAARLVAQIEVEAAASYLGHVTATTIMTPRPDYITPDTRVSQAVLIAQEHPQRVILVAKCDGSFCGILARVSLIGADEQHEVAPFVERADTVRPDTDLGVILPLIEQSALRILPVVDEHNCLVGVITRTDVIALMTRALQRASVE